MGGVGDQGERVRHSRRGRKGGVAWCMRGSGEGANCVASAGVVSWHTDATWSMGGMLVWHAGKLGGDNVLGRGMSGVELSTGAQDGS